MTDFAAMPLTEVAALNTPEALDYFWAHVDDGYFADREEFYQEVAEYSAKFFSYQDTTCDYGCGCGHFLELYEYRHRNYSRTIYFGLDYSHAAIQRARMRDNYGDTFYLQHDIVKPFFVSSLINAAFCIEVLEHITEYRKALDNMMTSLVVDGHLIITVPNNDGWHGHVNHWTQESFLALLSEYGEATVDLFHEGHNLIGHVVKR